MTTGRQSLEPGVSVVVPAFHSAGLLTALADRVAEALGSAGLEYELVIVDDGSDDGTWEAVTALAAEGRPIRGLRLSRNCGQHNALLAGIRAARRETVVTLDDDLQYRPESVPHLLEAIEGGADLVYGEADKHNHGWARGLATRFSKWLIRIATGEPMVGSISALRAFRTDLRDSFSGFDSPYVSLDVLLLWSTSRIVVVPVRHDPRVHGDSGYSLRSLARHALTITVGFSSRPLRAASLLGFACTALGLILFADVLIRYLADGGKVPGFAFIASAISIFSGAQLFAIGVIGEYLARMYPRVIGQPAYSIAERVGEES